MSAVTEMTTATLAWASLAVVGVVLLSRPGVQRAYLRNH